MQNEIDFLDDLVNGVDKLYASVDDTRTLHKARGLDVGIWIVLGAFIETLGGLIDSRLNELRLQAMEKKQTAAPLPLPSFGEVMARELRRRAAERQAEAEAAAVAPPNWLTEARRRAEQRGMQQSTIDGQPLSLHPTLVEALRQAKARAVEKAAQIEADQKRAVELAKLDARQAKIKADEARETARAEAEAKAAEARRVRIREQFEAGLALAKQAGVVPSWDSMQGLLNRLREQSNAGERGGYIGETYDQLRQRMNAGNLTWRDAILSK